MSEENRESQNGLTPEASNSRGVSRRTFLRRAGGAAAVATLAPFSAIEAFAEAGNPSNIELSQSTHDMAFDHVKIRPADKSNYLSGWFLNKVGQPIYPDFVKYVADPEENLGNGFTSYSSESIDDKLKQRVIIKDGQVVFKNAIVGPLVDGEFDVTNIPSTIASHPPVTPAPEYGNGLVRVSLPERGIAVIAQPTGERWEFYQVFAVEGFIATENPTEYAASPWLNKSTDQQAATETEPGAGIADNPQ